ncbi:MULTISPECIES: siderophore-iron reductase FhuF [unclassified Pseudomonas]|uniref:siderophore-iron reductase FhuF n=1 Tax=unclassified Pseudomonas TaxID=196821 RepID=UPI000D38A54B|nr:MULTISPECIES: siderophore-iron reductase FhuF [unclassified Pseudomonas]RAU49708.1 siderophore-iron reductase FhuF [Pseudomonas sp. RIT 409]RAU56364.1 siderophore-iron reductase FhuF [Pseudomonas sp. RIT 412]
MFQPHLATPAGTPMSRHLFEGPLAGFAKTWVPEDPRPVIPVATLLCDETLDRLLMQTYGPELMPAQRSVLVSQWFKFYAMQLIPPVVVASLVGGMGWPLGLEQVGFVLSENGVLDGVWFDAPASRASHSQDPFERLAPLLSNLQRVIERLCVYGEVATGVLWSSAGDYLETCLRELSASHPQASEVGYGLLRDRLRPDGQRNPLFNAVYYKESPRGALIRQRRSCCLSHRVEWVGRCEHCPLGRGN